MIKTTSGSSARGACPLAEKATTAIRYRAAFDLLGMFDLGSDALEVRGSWGRATPSTASCSAAAVFARARPPPRETRERRGGAAVRCSARGGLVRSLRAEGDRPSPPASRTSELALDAPTGTCRRTGGAARGRSAGGSPQTSGRRRRRLSRCNHARVLHRPPSRLTPHRASTPPSRCRWFSPDIDFIRLIMCARPAMYVSSPRSRPVARRLFRARSRGRVRGGVDARAPSDAGGVAGTRRRARARPPRACARSRRPRRLREIEPLALVPGSARGVRLLARERSGSRTGQ